MELTNTITDKDAFLRELHHRVKNNFQIIASLINLQKRMLPVERQSEVRFIEEHVQSMAVAYRIVTTTDGVVQVSLNDLVSEVVDGLRVIAGFGRGVITVSLPEQECLVRIEQAIAIGLYLAALVPPYLDSAAAIGGTLRIALVPEGAEQLILTMIGAHGATNPPDKLRQRLVTAYLRQLRTEFDPEAPAAEIRVRLRIQPPGSGVQT